MSLKSFLIFILIFTGANLFAPANLFAESGSSVTAEIQNMERIIARQGVSAAERHSALVNLARLRQLSGDIEGAARNWLEAAGAIPGTVDDDALLACAYCLAAMGEWDRAAAALEPLVSKNIRARFLFTVVNALKTGNLSTLTALAANPEFSSLKHEALFLLWKASQRTTDRGERWRQQLVSEFPQSPEGRLASGLAVINPSPFWLFVNGLDSLPLLASESRNREQSSGSAVVQPPVQPPPVVQPVTPAGARLQTGVFSREGNAQAQAAALRQSGFSPSIEPRGEMWAVTVPAGTDATRTASDLRAAGFETFLVR